MGWEAYNPEWLARLAELQASQLPWLPEALRTCTRCFRGSDAYYYFVSPRNPNMPGSEWRHDRSVVMVDGEQGTIVLDILKGNRVGGVEFVDRI